MLFRIIIGVRRRSSSTFKTRRTRRRRRRFSHQLPAVAVGGIDCFVLFSFFTEEAPWGAIIIVPGFLFCFVFFPNYFDHATMQQHSRNAAKAPDLSITQKSDGQQQQQHTERKKEEKNISVLLLRASHSVACICFSSTWATFSYAHTHTHCYCCLIELISYRWSKNSLFLVCVCV